MSIEIRESPEPPPLSDEEAEAMLKRLSAHFHMPVMPIERYCTGLRTWQRALAEREERLRTELYPKLSDPSAPKEEQEAALALYRAEMNEAALRRSDEARYCKIAVLRCYESSVRAVASVFLDISKSALLDRLLYQGEALRTNMCPEHKGRWSGIEWGPENACPHGCGLTGWLPLPVPTLAITGAPSPPTTPAPTPEEDAPVAAPEEGPIA